MPRSAHTFHIPVLGTGFSIDTPIKVARYGISSVVSLVDDVLIEQMRKYHCKNEGEPYQEISKSNDDSRANRITEYLNLLDRIVKRQVKKMQASSFEKGSEITKYYEMLPDNTKIKQEYIEMSSMADSDKSREIQSKLRNNILPGSIDVNIMTKLDRAHFRHGEKLPPESSDAMAALRGFAKSTLNSSIIFSAGINKQLYRYMTKFNDFFPDNNGEIKKKIVLKVSDYRSAEIQGRFLAKQGLWVSEFRIESGLNCGGHAFASAGHLLGPVLEEFKQRKNELIEKLHSIYHKAIEGLGRICPEKHHNILLTVQGGVGSNNEHELFLDHYKVDATGWGTPFMLVPEATNMDEENRSKLISAAEKNVILSESSPLGVRFWNLRNSSSELAREQRIEQGKPGTKCPKGFTVSNTEFTKQPICLSSRAYQEKKLRHLAQENHPTEVLEKLRQKVLAKSCICHDLAGNATLPLGIDQKAHSAVCCGPSIADFNKIASLKEMVDHIYGRTSLFTNSERPHVFIRELKIYIDYLREELDNLSIGLKTSTPSFLSDMRENLLQGIEYYQSLSGKIVDECRDKFLKELDKARKSLLPLEIK